jgi:DNA-binding IclR family transcriptional regulator
LTEKQNRISSIHKVLDILVLFQNTPQNLAIDEISQSMSIPKSTAYRYVRILCEREFLERTSDANYRLGVSSLMLSQAALKSNRDVRLVALAGMKRLSEKFGESVSLMRINNHQVVCVESIEGRQALRVSIERGRVQALHAGASSKLLLAHLPEEEWENLLDFPLKRFTDTTITDFRELADELRHICQVGYSVSDGEIDLGAKAVAVPLLDRWGKVVAALSIEAPALRIDDQLIQQFINALREESGLIQQEML